MKLPPFAAQPKTHRGPYCGPFALAAVTGRPMVEFLPRHHRTGNPRRAGMTSGTVIEHLKRAGFAVRTVGYQRHGKPMRRGVTLWRLLRANQRCLLMTANHWLAADGFLLADTGSAGPVWVHDHKWRNRRVRLVIIIEPIASRRVA